MRWILVSMMIAAPCFGGEPPFAHIRRSPSLTPYVRREQEFLNPYQMDPPQRQEEEVDWRRQPRQQPPRPVMPQTQGMRPTGHPTYFMIF